MSALDDGFAQAAAERRQQEEREISAEHFCNAAQQIDRWLVCTTSASVALAYSLDANAFARQPITGLSKYNVLAALPKSSQGSTPAIVSRQAAIDSVRALTVEVRRVDRIEAKLVSGASSPWTNFFTKPQEFFRLQSL